MKKEWKTGRWDIVNDAGDGSVMHTSVTGHMCGYYGIKESGNITITSGGVDTVLPRLDVDHIPTGYKVLGEYFFVRLDAAQAFVEWLLGAYDLANMTAADALNSPALMVQDIFTHMREFGALHINDDVDVFFYRFQIGCEAA